MLYFLRGPCSGGSRGMGRLGAFLCTNIFPSPVPRIAYRPCLRTIAADMRRLSSMRTDTKGKGAEYTETEALRVTDIVAPSECDETAKATITPSTISIPDAIDKDIIIKPIDISRNDFLQALGLKSFSDEELRRSFASLQGLDRRLKATEEQQRAVAEGIASLASKGIAEDNDAEAKGSSGLDEGVDVATLRRAVRERYFMETQLGSEKFRIANIEEMISMSGLNQDEKKIHFDLYRTKLSAFAERIDSKVWTIAAAFFLTGSSLGVVLPCMPLLVNQLGVSSTEFGIVVSSLSLAKLLSNIPASRFVETIGRKPLIISGLGLCALGIGGIGASLFPGLGLPWLIGCRVVTGVGVSAFVAGSFMYLIDLSTDLNRARTNAPATAAFNAGLAVGPAMGGVLLDQVGISYAYFTVGGLFAALTVLTQIIVKETKMMHLDATKQEPQIKDAFSVTFKKWRELFKLGDVRNLVLLNTFFWGCLGGIQMTMLPMLMLQPQLSLDVSQISASFAIISITSFLLAQPIAYISDRFDKIGVSCAGAMMIVGASMLIPHSMSFFELASALIPLSVGSTIMQSAPTSHMANIVPQGDKAQALSLLRTGGDIGMLCGASAAGIVAAMTSVQSMIMLDGGVLGMCTAAVAASHFISRPRPPVGDKQRR